MKKLLSVLLVIALIMGSLGTFALAADETNSEVKIRIENGMLYVQIGDEILKAPCNPKNPAMGLAKNAKGQLIISFVTPSGKVKSSNLGVETTNITLYGDMSKVSLASSLSNTKVGLAKGCKVDTLNNRASEVEVGKGATTGKLNSTSSEQIVVNGNVKQARVNSPDAKITVNGKIDIARTEGGASMDVNGSVGEAQAKSGGSINVNKGGGVNTVKSVGGNVSVAEGGSAKNVAVKDSKVDVKGSADNLQALGKTDISVGSSGEVKNTTATGETNLDVSGKAGNIKATGSASVNVNKGAVTDNIALDKDAKAAVAGNVTGTVSAEGKASVETQEGSKIAQLSAKGESSVKTGTGSYVGELSADEKSKLTTEKGSEALNVKVSGESSAELGGTTNKVVVAGDSDLKLVDGSKTGAIDNKDANKDFELGKGATAGTVTDEKKMENNGGELDPSIEEDLVADKPIESKPSVAPSTAPTTGPTSAPSVAPTASTAPTAAPSALPTVAPTAAPTGSTLPPLVVVPTAPPLPTSTPEATPTPVPTATATPVPTATPTATPAPTATATPAPTATATPAPTATATPSPANVVVNSVTVKTAATATPSDSDKTTVNLAGTQPNVTGIVSLPTADYKYYEFEYAVTNTAGTITLNMYAPGSSTATVLTVPPISNGKIRMTGRFSSATATGDWKFVLSVNGTAASTVIIKTVSADTAVVSTAAELKTAATTNSVKKIMISGNVTLTESITILTGVTLEISGATAVLNVPANQTLTMNNGSILNLLSGATLTVNGTLHNNATTFKRDAGTKRDGNGIAIGVVYAESSKEAFKTAMGNDSGKTSMTWDILITGKHYLDTAKTHVPGLTTANSAEKTALQARLETLKTYYESIKTLDMSGKTQSNFTISTDALTHLTKLEDLNLSGTGMVETTTNHTVSTPFGGLLSLTALKKLNVSNTGFGNASLGAINSISSIADLNLSETAVTDIGPIGASSYKGTLVNLDISKSKVEQLAAAFWVDNAPALTALKSLKATDLRLTGITGLVMVVNYTGNSSSAFNLSGITWNLSGSTLAHDDAIWHIRTIASKFTSNSSGFTPPNPIIALADNGSIVATTDSINATGESIAMTLTGTVTSGIPDALKSLFVTSQFKANPGNYTALTFKNLMPVGNGIKIVQANNALDLYKDKASDITNKGSSDAALWTKDKTYDVTASDRNYSFLLVPNTNLTINVNGVTLTITNSVTIS